MVRATICALQPHKSVGVGLCCPGGGHDAVSEVWLTHRPLEDLLGAHGEAKDGAQVGDVEFLGEEAMNSLNVVANRSDREAGSVERLRSVARGRGMAIAEQYRGHEKKL